MVFQNVVAPCNEARLCFLCVIEKLACFFFSYLSILYQRGVYPAECFKREQRYDLTLFTCDNKELQEYLSSVLKQLKGKMNANVAFC